MYLLSLGLSFTFVDKLIPFDIIMFRDHTLLRFAVTRESFGAITLGIHFKNKNNYLSNYLL